LTVDEPFMANSARLPWSQLFAVFRTDNIPFPYLLLRIWTALFGESEVALRSLSTAAYGAAVLLAGIAGRMAAGDRAGLAAATLMATSAPMGIVHAATARPYALLSLMAAASVAQSISLVCRPGHSDRRRRLRVAALTATHLLGLWTHPTYVFVMLALPVGSALSHRPTFVANAFASALALGAYVTFWGPVVAETFRLQPTSWMQPPHLRDLRSAFQLLWGVGPGFILIGALIVAALDRSSRVTEWAARPVIRWILAAAATLWIVPIVVSFWKPVFVASRTPMVCLPLTTILIGAALAALTSRAALCILSAAFIASAVQHAASSGRTDSPPTRATIASVVAEAKCGDTLLAVGLAHAPVEYYLRQLVAPPCLQYERFPADMVNWTGRIAGAGIDTLQLEGHDLAVRLTHRPGTLWLFALSRGMGHEASTIIQTHLAATFDCRGHSLQRGAFFDQVLRCEPKRNEP
jgi:hypothetical protein